VIAVAGLVFGQEAARGQIVDQIAGQIGAETAETIQTMIENTGRQDGGILISVIGVVTIVLGAAGFFGQLQDALNTVWEVTPKPGGNLLDMIKARFLSFTMVLGIGFLLLVSLIISTLLANLSTFVSSILPGAEFLAQIINFMLSFGVVTLLFAMIYKVLPDVIIGWRDVWVGAVITALLFNLGKFLLGLYLGNTAIASSYGAAGSLVVLLVWVFYSAQILLFGAEFTQVYARRYGSHILPAENAVAVTDAERAQEGLCD
jgi:membrane protein